MSDISQPTSLHHYSFIFQGTSKIEVYYLLVSFEVDINIIKFGY